MHSCLSLQDTLTTEHVQSLSLIPHLRFSLSLKYWKCLPRSSALALSSSSHLIPHFRSSSLWRSKWRQRSYLLSSSSLAKLAVVASIDSYRHLSPLLWRASEQTSCSFVIFPSLQPQACLPTESKRETLIINSAKVIAVTTPICRLRHICSYVLLAMNPLRWLKNWWNNIFTNLNLKKILFYYPVTKYQPYKCKNCETPEPPVFVLVWLVLTVKV